LNAIDDAFTRQVIENTNTKIILKVNDPETAQLFADSMGTAQAASSQVRFIWRGKTLPILWETFMSPMSI